jgi:hypothetical protein
MRPCFDDAGEQFPSLFATTLEKVKAIVGATIVRTRIATIGGDLQLRLQLQQLYSAFHATSCASGSRAIAEKQNEKVEKPDTNCGHRCSHIGPSGSPQNLLNSDYLLIASDDSLTHQQIFRP